MLPGKLPGSFCICVPDKFDRKVCYLKKKALPLCPREEFR